MADELDDDFSIEAWIKAKLPDLPQRLGPIDGRYIGFDGVKRMVLGPDDPLTEWAGGEATHERFNLVISWPVDGDPLTPWINRLERGLDIALGLKGRFATPELPSEPKPHKGAADANTPAVSSARRGNPTKRVRHYDCKSCKHQWNQRTDGSALPCRRCKASCIPTYAKDRTAEQLEAFNAKKCGVEWCAKLAMPGHGYCNGPCRSAADLEAMNLERSARRESIARMKQIAALKERCAAVERRFLARGIHVEPAVKDGNMAVRFLAIEMGSPLHAGCVDKVWTLTKCEEWLDRTPLKQ